MARDNGLVDPRLGKRIIAKTRLARQEKQIENAINKALSNRKVKVLAALRTQHLTAAAPPDPFDINTWDTEVDDSVVPAIKNFVSETTTGVFNALALPPETRNQLMTTLDTSEMTNYFADRVRSIGPDTADSIAELISQGIAKGQGVSEIADNISDAFNVAENDAARIARTETHGVAEGTSHASASAVADAGFNVTKEWLATDDDRTREDHADADGQVVDISDTFTVGGSDLAYPGDPDGDGDQVINCRCSVIYDTPDSGIDGATSDLGESEDGSDQEESD